VNHHHPVVLDKSKGNTGRGIGGSGVLQQLMSHPTASLDGYIGRRRNGSEKRNSPSYAANIRGSGVNEGSNQRYSTMQVERENSRQSQNKANAQRSQKKAPPTVIDLLDDEPSPVCSGEAPSLELLYRSALGDSIVDSQVCGATGNAGRRIPVDRIYLGAFPFESHGPRSLSLRVDVDLSECVRLGISDSAEGMLSDKHVEYEDIPFKAIKKIS